MLSTNHFNKCGLGLSWVEVDLDIITKNFQSIEKHVGTTQSVIPVVKGDAYGHGAVGVTWALTRAGATMVAVASLDEAMILREHGITCDILVMSYIPPEHIKIARNKHLTVTIYDFTLVSRYANVLQAEDRDDLGWSRRSSQCETMPLDVHIKVDTGMGRLGVSPDEALSLAKSLNADTKIFQLSGMYTHFSCAESGGDKTNHQEAKFRHALETLSNNNIPLRYIHTANSAATMSREKICGNAVRCGKGLYGWEPDGSRLDTTLKRGLKWVSNVIQVKCLPANHSIGYCDTYHTAEPEHVAVVPVGYKDGFKRALTNKGSVLIRGQRCPVRGIVSMEKLVVSVEHLMPMFTDTPITIGDEVVLLGRQGSDEITPEEIAPLLDTITSDILVTILPRSQRIYKFSSQDSQRDNSIEDPDSEELFSESD